MSYKLFLDDIRDPVNCVTYMHSRIGAKNPIYLEDDWVIVRSYSEFTSKINERGLPAVISFDHDLADVHYCPVSHYDSYDEWAKGANSTEKNGYECAKWLVGYCVNNRLDLPECYIHSMNPVGSQNIHRRLKDFSSTCH